MSLWLRRLCLIIIPVGIAISIASSLRGDGKQPSKNLVSNAGFEEPLEPNGLPKYWSFPIASGTYKYQVTNPKLSGNSAHSGKYAMAFGGSGGTAEIVTNPFHVPGDAIIEYEAWLQKDLVRDGETTVYLKSSEDQGLLTDSTVVDLASNKPTESAGSEPTGINTRTLDWQRIHSYYRFKSGAPDSSLQLAIRLKGEALVRVDDLVLTMLTPAGLVADSGFESLDQQSVSSDWRHIASDKKGKFEKLTESPHQGNSCIRLRGSDEWGVLATHRHIQSKSAHIVARAYFRATNGKGTLKLDYYKDGNTFASTLSTEATQDWTLAVVESQPELVAVSDWVCVTLAANRNKDSKEYIVDFDDVEIYASK